MPSITIAQAILESNFGQSELSLEANNLFGIKVGLNWEGEAITVSTMEGYNTEVMDDFRSYDSVSDSSIAHGLLLIIPVTRSMVFLKQKRIENKQKLWKMQVIARRLTSKEIKRMLKE